MQREGTPESVLIHTGSEILHADEMFLALIGADSRDEVVGCALTEFVAPDFHDELLAQVNRIEAGDVPALGLTVTLQAGPNQQREVVAVSSPVTWNGTTRVQTSFLNLSGPAPGAGATLRDAAMDEAPIGITISDPTRPDNPLIYANDGFCELTGYPRDEVLGRNCRFLQGPETRAEPVAKMRAAIADEEPITVELRNYRKDGTMFWNRIGIFPIESPAGEVTHYLGYQQDVSDTKLYEQEKTLFKRHADAAEHAMFITDREGTIEYVNPAFERITGYTATEAIGCTPRILKSGEQGEAFYKELWETITRGDTWEAELTNQTKAGKQYRVKQTIVPITDDREEITHFASIEYDITDETLRSRTLSVLNRVLRHNLRTAISVIDGYAELLESDPGPAMRKTALDAIRDQTAAMESIADKAARIRSLSERTYDPPPWQVADITTRIDAYRTEYPAATISLAVEVDESVHLPDGEICGLALDEAVENAVRHTGQDAPSVDITVAWADDHDRVAIRVADSGPGIPDIERQLGRWDEETPLSHGRGIGLWLIEWATTSLGGAFQITDRELRGTEVALEFPVVDAQES